jgi:hypothetical protein
MVTQMGNARIPGQGPRFAKFVSNWATTDTVQRASLVIKVQSSTMH